MKNIRKRDYLPNFKDQVATESEIEHNARGQGDDPRRDAENPPPIPGASHPADDETSEGGGSSAGGGRCDTEAVLSSTEAHANARKNKNDAEVEGLPHFKEGGFPPVAKGIGSSVEDALKGPSFKAQGRAITPEANRRQRQQEEQQQSSQHAEPQTEVNPEIPLLFLGDSEIQDQTQCGNNYDPSSDDVVQIDSNLVYVGGRCRLWGWGAWMGYCAGVVALLAAIVVGGVCGAGYCTTTPEPTVTTGPPSPTGPPMDNNNSTVPPTTAPTVAPTSGSPTPTGPPTVNNNSTLPPTTAPTLAPTSTPMVPLLWTPVGNAVLGQDLENGLGNHFFGLSTSISSNGNIVAVGAHADNQVLTDQNYSWVEVYQLNAIETDWELVGDKIFDSTQLSLKADSVFLSAMGDRVVVFSAGFWDTTTGYTVGLVKIFDFDGEKWNLNHALVGNNQTQYTIHDYQHEPGQIRKVHVSSNGNYVAIVNWGIDPSTSQSLVGVTVFRIYDGWTDWRSFTLFHNDEEDISGFGGAVAISQSADVVVVGASGLALVYTYGGSGWITPGARLDGGSDSTSDFGKNVAISGDGSTIAICDRSSFASAGSVTVYRNKIGRASGVWEQLGSVLHAVFDSGEWLEGTVFLSEDGNMVGFRSNFGDVESPAWGVVRFFQYKDEDWEEMDSLQASTNTAYLKCALTGDGMNMCCGEPYYYHTYSSCGRMQVYSMSS